MNKGSPIRKSKRVQVAKGKYLPKKEVKTLRKKPGMSNVGKYKSVSPTEFAGPSGTYPIDTVQRAKSALKLAHNAKNPAAIKRKVYTKYPHLRPKKK